MSESKSQNKKMTPKQWSDIQSQFDIGMRSHQRVPTKKTRKESVEEGTKKQLSKEDQSSILDAMRDRQTSDEIKKNHLRIVKDADKKRAAKSTTSSKKSEGTMKKFSDPIDDFGEGVKQVLGNLGNRTFLSLVPTDG